MGPRCFLPKPTKMGRKLGEVPKIPLTLDFTSNVLAFFLFSFLVNVLAFSFFLFLIFSFSVNVLAFFFSLIFFSSILMCWLLLFFL